MIVKLGIVRYDKRFFDVEFLCISSVLNMNACILKSGFIQTNLVHPQ